MAAARLVAFVVGAACAACSPSSPRDVVPVTKDVRTTPEPETYEHVAKRPHGTIALAESRGMTKDDAASAIDALADQLERCATGLEAQGQLVEGAARLVAAEEASWASPAITSIKLGPGSEQNALVCLIAPLRATHLARSGTAAAVIAIEAVWQPARPIPDAGRQL